jgi:nicotinamidase-related amidase
MSKALLVIDIQNDYFPAGAFPLWSPERALASVERALARAAGIQIILVQHVAARPGPFFNPGTPGVEIHPRVRAAAPDAPVVVKAHADAFLATTLADELARIGADQLVVCGMMTHNCVTHTAISKAAERYTIAVAADACTSVSEPVHLIALNALADRVRVAAVDELI